MRKKRTPPKPPLAPKFPVADREVRGDDDRPISRGNVVRRVEHVGTLGVAVPQRRGRVVDIYRRSADGPVIVDFIGSDRDGQGLYSGYARDIRRSAAQVEVTGLSGTEE